MNEVNLEVPEVEGASISSAEASPHRSPPRVAMLMVAYFMTAIVSHTPHNSNDCVLCKSIFERIPVQTDPKICKDPLSFNACKQRHCFNRYPP